MIEYKNRWKEKHIRRKILWPLHHSTSVLFRKTILWLAQATILKQMEARRDTTDWKNEKEEKEKKRRKDKRRKRKRIGKRKEKKKKRKEIYQHLFHYFKVPMKVYKNRNLLTSTYRCYKFVTFRLFCFSIFSHFRNLKKWYSELKLTTVSLVFRSITFWYKGPKLLAD